MKKKFITLGKITIPVSKRRKQTGTYTSLSGKEVMANIQVRFYPPTVGNPLYKEAPSKSYKSRVPNTRPDSM